MLEGKPISFKMPVLHPGPVYLNFFRFSGPQDYCAIWRERMTFVYLPNLEIFIVIIFQFPVVCIHKSHSHKWLLSQKFSLRGVSWGHLVWPLIQTRDYSQHQQTLLSSLFLKTSKKGDASPGPVITIVLVSWWRMFS